MRRIQPLILLLVFFAMFACKDKKVELPESPAVQYQNLKNFNLNFENSLALDINKDGVRDFSFVASFVEGSGNNRMEFTALVENENVVLADARTPKVLNKNEQISIDPQSRFGWSKFNPILAFRIYTLDPAQHYWEGEWKDQEEKYLGVKVKTNGQYYSGWIRISTSKATSKLIIHDCAVSKVPNVEILAGAKS